MVQPSMQTFLEDIADHIINTYAGKTGDICIVTPNRRAGLFFRKYFAARVQGPVWAPEMLSIEDFINRLSGLTICDSLDLIFELYECYKSIEGDNAESIESFLNWAPALLRDFDDIDSSLIDRKDIYGDIRDFRHMDLWVPGENDLTPFQRQYLRFIDRMQVYHDSLTQRLLEKRMGWQGLSTNLVANQLKAGKLAMPWEKMIFTGFNALTGAEESIVKQLLSEDRAEYLVDDDPYYADDLQHEAGRFIRKYKKVFHIEKKGSNHQSHFKAKKKKIRIYGIAKNVNQARLAGNLFLSDADTPQDERTAIVLANEALLIPTLNSLPESIKDINVTMGYPLSNTNMFGFFDAIFQLFMQAIHEQPAKGPQPTTYHYLDLQRFFSHSSVALLWDMDMGEELCLNFLQKLRQGNQSFLSYADIFALTDHHKGFKQKFGFLASEWSENPGSIFDAFLHLAGELDSLFREKAALFGGDIIRTPFFADFESLYYFSRLFRKLKTFCNKFSFLASIKTLYRLFRQSANETRLSFSGEPLQGLQLMGLLETRILDFRHVVILSANENILPRSSASSSFIPYEVKRSRGLRVYHDQDAMYAYHFYRLLQRADNITILYNTQTEEMGSNEKSRYITQLLHELPDFNPDISITENIVSLQPIPGQKKSGLKVTKTPDILNRLGEMAQNGFSPSALSNYITCPLQFYLKRVARIDEADSVEETMEAMTVGNIAHGVLEALYQPHLGSVLQPMHVEKMQKELADQLAVQLEKIYPGGHITSGKNLLTKHLICRYLENFLHAESIKLKKLEAANEYLTIEGLETQLSTTLILDNDNGNQMEVVVKGKADRIDRTGHVVSILDYKTGKVESSELSFNDWDDPFSNIKKIKSFQLLTYAWLYYRVHPETHLAVPGIISLRSPGKGIQNLKIQGANGDITKDSLHEFEARLKVLLKEIMDPAVEFNQTDQMSNCKYCPFINLCSRHEST